jgi:3-oxoacyl-[acyl-carrier protein] reductase
VDLGLKNKVALVTGSSRGLGYATALLLAQEGAEVVINSRDPNRLEQARQSIVAHTGARVLALPGDVTLPETPTSLLDPIARQMGRLDILITNTGGPRPGSFESLEETDWQQGIDLCLMAHVRLIKAALPLLKQSRAGSILTITSISVKQPIQNLILSNSIRAATIGLTKSLALELGAQGIRVNSILPAWTETERIRELLENRARLNGTTIEEEMEKQSRESPLGRISTPEEFARAAVFLVSPAASYLTGVMLPVDGGMYKGTF